MGMEYFRFVGEILGYASATGGLFWAVCKIVAIRTGNNTNREISYKRGDIELRVVGVTEGEMKLILGRENSLMINGALASDRTSPIIKASYVACLSEKGTNLTS